MGISQELLSTFFTTAGQSILHAAFPDDFELYLTALEVRDEDDKINPIKEYLLFPVNPDSAMIVQKTFAKVTKTFYGIHILDNETFVPTPLNISGGFGAGLKTVFAGETTIKTGYGVIKYLKKLVDTSKSKNSNGKPYRTIFYNLAFGETYTVIINDCKFNQSVEQNRIWKYDLNMTAVAPGDINSAVSHRARLAELLGMNIIQKQLNIVLKEGKKILASRF